MPKIETTSKVSLKLTSRINLGRWGAHRRLAPGSGHSPQAPPQPWKGQTPGTGTPRHPRMPPTPPEGPTPNLGPSAAPTSMNRSRFSRNSTNFPNEFFQTLYFIGNHQTCLSLKSFVTFNMHKIILSPILKKDTIQVSHIFREISSSSDELWKPPKTHCDVKESTLNIIINFPLSNDLTRSTNFRIMSVRNNYVSFHRERASWMKK